QTVFMRNWPYAIDVTTTAHVPWEWDVCMLPGETLATRGSATLGGWHLAGNVATKNPNATAAVLKFLSSAPVEKARYMSVGVLPTISSLYKDAEICEKLKHCDLFGQLLVNPRPSAQTTPRYLDVSTVVYTSVAAFLSSQISLSDLMEGVEVRAMQTMGIYGTYVLSLATHIEVNSMIAIVFMSLSGIGIIFSLACVFLVFVNRAEKNIKASSPDFLYVILVGIMMGFGTVFVYVGQPTKTTCLLQPWLLVFSFSLTNSALLSKTWRIFRIFGNNKKLSASSLSSWGLIRNMAIVSAVEGLIMILWTVMDPPVPAGAFETPDIAFLTCSSKKYGTIFTGVLFAINGAMLVAGTWLAYKTRNVDAKFRESFFIAAIMYNTFIWSVIAISLVFLKQLGGSVQFIIRSVVILMASAGALFLLFGPKFLNIYFPDKRIDRLATSSLNIRKTDEIRKSGGANTGVSLGITSTNTHTVIAYCRVGSNQMFLGSWMSGRILIHGDRDTRALMIVPTNPDLHKCRGHCISLPEGRSVLIRCSGEDWDESTSASLDYVALMKLPDDRFYELQFENRTDLDFVIGTRIPTPPATSPAAPQPPRPTMSPLSRAAVVLLIASSSLVTAHQGPRANAGISFGPSVPQLKENAPEFLSAWSTTVPISTAEAVQRAIEYAESKLQHTDSKLTVSDSYTDRHNGVTHVYLVQVVDGLEVVNGVGNVHVGPRGDILTFGASFYGVVPEPEVRTGGDDEFAPEFQHQGQQVFAKRAHEKCHDADDSDRYRNEFERPRRLGGKKSHRKPHFKPVHRKKRPVITFFDSFGAESDITSPVSALLSLTSKLGITMNADDVTFTAYSPIRAASRSDPHFILAAPLPRASRTGAFSSIAEPVNVPCKLKYIQTSRGELKHVWDLELDLIDNWFNAHVAALRGPGQGEVLSLVDWVSDASYHVFPLGVNDPESGDRVKVQDPHHKTSSPYGWHWQVNASSGEPIEYTVTIGNNVYAHENLNGRSDWMHNGRPDGTSALDFDFPVDFTEDPVTYLDAAVTNLFYWCNSIHDLFYVYGFNERAGNFQQDNLGRGGSGDDAVLANAQDGSGTNNANFATPPDGGHGRMRMYVWDVTEPARDGDFEGGIIVHEYAHGISIRLTGGPSNSGCLGWGEAGGMGEGWGDFFATILRMTPNSTREDVFSMGEYANGGQGIRKYSYSTSKLVNPSTYAYVMKPAYWGVHAKGEVWAVILYEVYWNLVDAHGFNPDWHDTELARADRDPRTYRDFATGQVRDRAANDLRAAQQVAKEGWESWGGNVLALQLVVDGLKMQVCNPSFVDARNAILAADKALTGGANECLLYKGFAKRGLGVKARANGFEDFSVPARCG
ncbi:Fungalysin/Thermolysin Extracellular metalloproteinase 5, partial [Irineochytrium annulatum]